MNSYTKSSRWTRLASRAIIVLALLSMGGGLIAFHYQTQWRMEQVDKDFQMLTTAFAQFGLDRCGSYMPPDTWHRRRAGADLPATFETDVAFITHWSNPETGKVFEYWYPLTTPIAYAAEIPDDPFARGAKYGYLHLQVPTPGCPDAGVVRSLGPDGDADLDLDALRADLEEWRRRTADFTGAIDPYDTHEWLRERLVVCLYDPTNGTASSGDVLGLKLMHHTTLVNWNTPATVETMRGQKMQAHNPPATLPHTGLGLGATVEVPAAFVERINALEMYTHLYGGMEAQHAWDYASNQFRAFTPWFFENPAVLDESGRQSLAALREWKPAWWNFIADTGLLTDSATRAEMDRGRLTVFAPLVGKSLLLDAADRAGRGDAEGARRAMDQLGALIALLNPGDPRQEYIRSRLETMRAALLKDIEAREGAS